MAAEHFRLVSLLKDRTVVPNNSRFFPFLDCQDDLRKNELVQLQINDEPFTGYLFYGLIHDDVNLASEPIQDHDIEDKTPFQAWSSSGNADETIYRRMTIAKLGPVFGAIIPADNEKIVNFKFPVLSSDQRSKFTLKSLTVSQL